MEEEDRRDEINREESEEMDVLVIVLVVGLLSNVTDGGGFPKNNIKLNYIITVYLTSAALKAFVSIARRNTKTNSGRALLLDFFLTSSSLSSFYSNIFTIRKEHTNLFFFVRNGRSEEPRLNSSH